ncbi:ABC transporter ATP-binding protein [Streptococcus catagoni]|uniref:ABC transporter ATP-binding protein n=1 Tax=Streptococcus catagoni TaxID=2654874 RepID=UPI0014099E6B|nr:ABC transporter ATP-binding protein [Streptococcus catagoni]
MDTFKGLFAYAREKRLAMIASLILSALATLFSFLPYYYFWQLLKEVTSSNQADHIRHLSFLIFLATVLYSLTYLLSLICSHIYAFRLESNMRKEGLKHLLGASFSFFDKESSGKVRKIIDDNASNTHTVIAHLLPDAVNAFLFPIGLLILAFVANWMLGLLVLVTIALSLLCFKFMYSDPNMMEDYMRGLEDINSETVEYVRGIQVIKIFGVVIESFDKLYTAIVHYAKVVNKQCQDCKLPFTLFQTLTMSFGSLVIVYAYSQWNLARSGELISLVVFFMTFSALLGTAFSKIMLFSKDFQLAKDAIDKLEGLFVEMDKDQLSYGNRDHMPNYSISFSQVSFEYEKGLPVIQDLDLYLEEKKTYVFVGSSGSGKSTIAKLISGFYPINKGQLKIGGYDISDYTAKTLEESIAFVFQDAKLFKTTIFENVQLARPKASREEVLEALSLARCDSILAKFETREETVIGSQGVHLSGGEKQRIAIARAILKNAPILILDEASAASDPENEYEIQRAFEALMKDKTVIMIAHRLPSIKNVDEILVIDHGKVIERGQHASLYAAKGKYQKLQDLYAQANEWRIANEG